MSRSLVIEIAPDADRVKGAFRFAYDKSLLAIRNGKPIVMELRRKSRSKEQNAKFHAMITDIMKHCNAQEYIESRPFEVWKALLVDGFEQELKANGEQLSKPSQAVISLDKQRAVTVRPSTTEFRKSEAAQFIEYLYSFGAEHGVVWGRQSQEVIDGRQES